VTVRQALPRVGTACSIISSSLNLHKEKKSNYAVFDLWAAYRSYQSWCSDGQSLEPLSPEKVMTHKYRGCIIVLLINKSVEPNEEQKVLTSGFDQGFTVKLANGFSGVFGNANK
jgi:hypothetical protein